MSQYSGTKGDPSAARQKRGLFLVAPKVGRDLFYRLILPALAMLNLGLGVFLLTLLPPQGPIWWPVALTAAFCCAVGGWLGASAWSKSYWAIVMTRQVVVWRRMVDAIFEWLEEAPVPADSIERLKRRLEDVRH
jgi:hypothetical protein